MWSRPLFSNGVNLKPTIIRFLYASDHHLSQF